MQSAFIFSLPDSCAHLNVRIPLGPFVTWVNNPQWHRIHHSALHIAVAMALFATPVLNNNIIIAGMK
jgi:sterol desaturase/sphingolipid hydroxylase (fatty acid hydroxylase superfamily)